MHNLRTYWDRYSKKIIIRLKRLQGTPYSIASGFACGVAISFTPLIGFHMVLAALTAWISRGNIIASAIGTIIGNPWTFPFIWAAVLYTGNHLLGNADASSQVDFLATFSAAGDALYNLNWDKFGKEVWPIIHPMLIGCIPFYIASWIISYKLMKKTLDKLEAKRQSRLKEKTE